MVLQFEVYTPNWRRGCPGIALKSLCGRGRAMPNVQLAIFVRNTYPLPSTGMWTALCLGHAGCSGHAPQCRGRRVPRSSRGMELMMAILYVVFGLTVVVGTTLAAVVVISLRTRRCGAIPRAPAAPIFFNAERQQHRFINLLGWCCHAKPRPDRQAWPTVLCRIYERDLADRREQHVLLKTSVLDREATMVKSDIVKVFLHSCGT